MHSGLTLHPGMTVALWDEPHSRVGKAQELVFAECHRFC